MPEDSVSLTMKTALTHEMVKEAVEAGDCEDNARSIADMLEKELLEEGPGKDPVDWRIKVVRSGETVVRSGYMEAKES